MDLYRFRAFLDNEECEQAKRFRLEKDQRRFIARRGKLRQLLSQLLDCEPSQVPLSRNSFGKPFVRKTDLRFNASHSRNIALIAVAHGQEVGCDIEARDARFASQVDFERFFRPPKRASCAVWTQVSRRKRSSIAGRARRPTSRHSAAGLPTSWQFRCFADAGKTCRVATRLQRLVGCKI